MSYATSVLSQSPIAYWRLGEPSGSTMVDASGFGRDGTYINTPTFGVGAGQTADNDTAVLFNGFDEYATVASDTVYDFAGAFTLEMWAKTASLPFKIAFNKEDQYRLFAGDVDGTKLSGRYWIGTSGWVGIVGATTLSTGQWYYAAMVYDGAAVQLYLNGVADGSPVSVTGAVHVATNAIFIGDYQAGSPGTFSWDGAIDEVALFASALSPSQLLARYLLSAQAITHQGGHALPMRRYGSFAGRTSVSGAHPVTRLTQQGGHAVPMRRYGSFASKATAGAGVGTGTFIPVWRPRRR